MARAKNRGYQQTLTPTYTIRRWRLGAYIRLSKEDLKKGKDDSNSVKNQRDHVIAIGDLEGSIHRDRR